LRVDQAFGGKYSHSDAHSFHSVDISMDEGTPVRAARSGVVMSVESDFHGAGTDIAKYGDRANHIRVVHSDGTMAVYAHLALESVLVSIGDRVRAGEVIAKSGNTGFSSGPHLHFVIQRNSGGTLVSVPFAFTVTRRTGDADSWAGVGGEVGGVACGSGSTPRAFVPSRAAAAACAASASRSRPRYPDSATQLSMPCSSSHSARSG
jgi:murein DD-endopeptidase MepM/ murein hydrolase activator NlpD